VRFPAVDIQSANASRAAYTDFREGDVMDEIGHSEAQRLAEAVRTACIAVALEGYENAAISGLCHEGAWEAAIGAMRMLDIEKLISQSL
jgi:hypothetical protein